MPAHLPNAAPDLKELAAREHDDGYDTQVAVFFGADYPEEDDPTEIESGDLGGRARARAQRRADSLPPLLTR